MLAAERFRGAMGRVRTGGPPGFESAHPCPLSGARGIECLLSCTLCLRREESHRDQEGGTFVLTGAGGEVRLSAATLLEDGTFSFSYDVPLLPGETVAICHFVAQSVDRDAALSKAWLGLGGIGVPPEIGRRILNFDTAGTFNGPCSSSHSPTTRSNPSVRPSLEPPQPDIPEFSGLCDRLPTDDDYSVDAQVPDDFARRLTNGDKAGPPSPAMPSFAT